MKTLFVGVFAALFLIIGSSLGQTGFSAILVNDSQMLTRCCDLEEPLPDGTIARVLYACADVYGQAPPVCTSPPCPTGSVTYNEFPLNGTEMGYGAGFFYASDPAFQSWDGIPVCSTFFIRVYGDTVHYGPNGDSVCVWESQPFSLIEGDNGEVFITGWSCHREGLTIPCIPTEDMSIPCVQWEWFRFDTCLTICPDHVTTLCIGPVRSPEFFPITFVQPCSEDPAEGWIFNASGWVWTQIEGLNYYCNWITAAPGTDGGCVCVIGDCFVPVEMGNIEFTPLNNAVRVSWTTITEHETERFDVLRDGERIASKPAQGESSTATHYAYSDHNATNGTTYTYQLVLLNLDGSSEILAIESVTPSIEFAIVEEFALHQNTPNPFNPTTTIRYDVKEAAHVRIAVFNALGQMITILADAQSDAGQHRAEFDGTNLPSGVYFLQMSAGGNFTATRKMLLLK